MSNVGSTKALLVWWKILQKTVRLFHRPIRRNFIQGHLSRTCLSRASRLTTHRANSDRLNVSWAMLSIVGGSDNIKSIMPFDWGWYAVVWWRLMSRKIISDDKRLAWTPRSDIMVFGMSNREIQPAIRVRAQDPAFKFTMGITSVQRVWRSM